MIIRHTGVPLVLDPGLKQVDDFLEAKRSLYQVARRTRAPIRVRVRVGVGVGVGASYRVWVWV